MLQFKAKGTRDSCESHLKDSIGRQKSEKTHCLSLICCEMILILESSTSDRSSDTVFTDNY